MKFVFTLRFLNFAEFLLKSAKGYGCYMWNTWLIVDFLVIVKLEKKHQVQKMNRATMISNRNFAV